MRACPFGRSQGARRQDGDPIHHLRDVVRRLGIHVLSSNYTFYGDTQRRVIAVCEPLMCDFESYSIDETFLDLAGFEGRELADHARTMREQVRPWTTIPTCVGLAETKTLAKLANDNDYLERLRGRTRQEAPSRGAARSQASFRTPALRTSLLGVV